MCEDTHYDRRRFLGATAMTMAAAQLGTVSLANAQPRQTKPSDMSTMQPRINTSWLSGNFRGSQLPDFLSK